MNRDLINRGEICETLVSTAGWRYLTEKINECIEIDKNIVFKLSLGAREIKDLEDIRAAATRIQCYEYIKKIPLEAIDKKNKESNKVNKQEENTKW